MLFSQRYIARGDTPEYSRICGNKLRTEISSKQTFIGHTTHKNIIHQRERKVV